MNFYRIADLNVAMDTFGRTARQSEAYRIPETTPDVVIRTDPAAAQKRYPSFSADDCEYMETSALFYDCLLDYDGMMLHASCVAVDGEAYLFSAPSGTEKSTHAQLWLEKFGERARILNDDKPALRWIGGECYVYGTPWSGKTTLNCNERAKLRGIAVLQRSSENYAEPISGTEAIFGILDQTVRPLSKDRMRALMSCIDRLVSGGLVYRIGVNLLPESVDVVYKAMHREDGNED